jgi:hypothetical protein
MLHIHLKLVTSMDLSNAATLLLTLLKRASLFVPANFLQAGLRLSSKAGAYPSGAHYATHFKGGSLALITNIRLVWKDLPVTNTLALFEVSVTKKKQFDKIDNWLQATKLISNVATSTVLWLFVNLPLCQ